MAKTVNIQRKRIGGNFSVAHAVNNQEIREHIRQIIPDVVFITLTLNRETQRKRIQVSAKKTAQQKDYTRLPI